MEASWGFEDECAGRVDAFEDASVGLGAVFEGNLFAEVGKAELPTVEGRS